MLGGGERRLCVLDVRPRTEFGICHLPGSISELRCFSRLVMNDSRWHVDVPIKELLADPSRWEREFGVEDTETYVVCRLGNDSQFAADALRSAGKEGAVKDLIGGLRAWAREVDGNFPIY